MSGPGKAYRKILVCVTEDWFALSHFKPLLCALRRVADEVVIATRDSGRIGELAALGVRVVPFDFARKSTAPHVVAAIARRLSSLVTAEQPDAVHLIALKPIVLGALALSRHASVRMVGVHLTGLGHLGVAADLKGRALRALALGLVRQLLKRPGAHLFVENEDDMARVRAQATRATVLGGAGIDPEHFAALAQTGGALTVAFVGRLVRSKGVDVLIEAARRMHAAGMAPQIDLFGGIDGDNPDAYGAAEIEAWQQSGLATSHGHVADVRLVWRAADVAVAPSRGGEGLPRSVLEAAACARAIVVTDVPGSRRFVRDGIDGLVVPPDDAPALAAALTRLAEDPALRRRLGAAARNRVLDGFTERDVEAAIERAYRERLLQD